MMYNVGDSIKYMGNIYRVIDTNCDKYFCHLTSVPEPDGMVYELEKRIFEVPNTPESPVFDDINHPKRYIKGGFECNDVIKARTQNLAGYDAVVTAHIFRYAWRWEDKQPIKSLQKIIYYAQDLIEELKKRGITEDAEHI